MKYNNMRNCIKISDSRRKKKNVFRIGKLNAAKKEKSFKLKTENIPMLLHNKQENDQKQKEKQRKRNCQLKFAKKKKSPQTQKSI